MAGCVPGNSASSLGGDSAQQSSALPAGGAQQESSPTPKESSPPIQGANEQPPAARVRSNPHTVVVELFTSQGCSSCPPADALLGKLANAPTTDGGTVIALSFHVDYWNYLGWADPFSSAAYSKRQRWYSRLSGQRSVYTPQMVVDGSDAFVGSNARQARTAIDRHAQRLKPSVIELSVEPGAALNVSYQVDNAPGEAYLHLALVQMHAQTDVERGENGGSTLSHTGVVRDFATTRFSKATKGQWSAGPVEAPQLRVVAYVQDPVTGEVLGAASGEPEGGPPVRER